MFVTAKVHSLLLVGLLTLQINFLTTFLITMASYELFEKMFLVVKRRFEYDSEKSEHTLAPRT